MPLKTTVRDCVNGAWGRDPNGGRDDVVCVRVADFDRERDRVRADRLTIRSVSPSERSNRLLQRGDLLLEKSGGGELQPVGKVVLFDLEQPAVCSNFVARMSVAPGFDSRFLTYLHRALYFARINTRSIKQNTGIQNLDSSLYLSERAGIPSQREQQAIADFLDRETAEVDALLTQRTRHLDLLEEYLQVRIDSSIETILRSHGSTKLKYLLSRNPRNGVSPRITEFGTIPTFSTAALVGSAINIDGHVKYADAAHEVVREFLVHRDDVLVLRGSGSKRLVGRAGIVACSPPEGCIYPDILIRLQPVSSVDRRLLVEVINGAACRGQFEQCAKTASGIWKITGEDIGNLLVPLALRNLPSGPVSDIHAARRSFDRTAEMMRRSMLTLREYRSALITAAVTGQIDVRSHAS